MTAGAIETDIEMESASRVMPVAGAFEPVAAAMDAADGDRNIIFGSLVTGDTDIVGLVAYSIYKQNKHDWLVAFSKLKGREPRDDEAQSYIIGESTSRRLATYRHLAQSTLDGGGPELSSGSKSDSAGKRYYPIAQRYKSAAGGMAGGPFANMLSLVALAIVALIAIYLAARYGLPGVSQSKS